MAGGIQISFDAHDAPALGRFWHVVLPHYVEQPPPEGHDSWEAFAAAVGLPASEIDRVYALVDPDGTGPRLLFQNVPEAKTSKNRVHLDVNVAGADHDIERVRAHAATLVAAGATLVEERHDQLSHWIVLTDPEGNELCLQ